MTIKDTLDSEISSVLASNQAGGMTAADLRQVLDDIVTALPVPAGASGDIQTNDGAGGLASLSRSGGVSTDYLARDNTYKTIPAGGGSGTPGGSNGQLQYNNAGALGGLTIGGDAALNPSTGALTVTKTSGTAFSALATAAAVALGSQVSGVLPVANGGTGTTTPSLVAGSNVSISGAWPNQLISAAGGGGGTVVGDSTATFNTRTSAAAATIASVATGGPSYIRTIGYALVNDGGGATYFRVGSAPTYSNLIWFQSVDGQYWSMQRTNEVLKPEQAGGGTSATGAANLAAVNALQSMFGIADNTGGNAYPGPNIQFGYGIYNFSAAWHVRGSCNIHGLNTGGDSGRGTILKFPANCDGTIFGWYLSDGRTLITADWTQGASGTVVRDLTIRGGWDGTTPPRTAANPTGAWGIGYFAKCPTVAINVTVEKFAEQGFYTIGTSGGGSFTQTDEPNIAIEGGPNSFSYYSCRAVSNGLDGFKDRGADANAGTYFECSAHENGQWGFNVLNFLGNSLYGCHAATNAQIISTDPVSGKAIGAYQCYGDSQFSTVVGCYSEADFHPSFFDQNVTVIGGTLAGGQSGPAFALLPQGQMRSAQGIRVLPAFTDSAHGTVISPSDVNDGLMRFDTAYESVWLRAEFGRLDLGTFSHADLLSLTLSGYAAAQGRSSSLPGGEVLFSRGVWLGGPQINSGFDLRFTGMSDGLPTAGKWARGDFVRMVNPSAGGVWAYVCTTGGDYAGTPPVWKSVGNLAA